MAADDKLLNDVLKEHNCDTIDGLVGHFLQDTVNKTYPEFTEYERDVAIRILRVYGEGYHLHLLAEKYYGISGLVEKYYGISGDENLDALSLRKHNACIDVNMWRLDQAVNKLKEIFRDTTLSKEELDCVTRLTSCLNLKAETQHKAVEILNQAKRAKILVEKNAAAIPAAIYVAGHISGEKPTLNRLGDFTGVTSERISRYKNKLVDELGL